MRAARVLAALIVAGVGLLFLNGAALAQTPTPPPPTPIGATLEALLAKAGSQGSISLIVGLRTAAPFKPESKLPSAAAVSGQKASIAQAQTGLINALASKKKRVNARYRHVPYIAMTLDRAGLEQLIASGLALTIKEDVPVRASMTAETALIRADSLWASGDDGDGWIVAIVDTGIDETHPYFSGRINQARQACFSNAGGAGTANGGTSLCPNGNPTQTGAGSADITLSGCPVPWCDHGTHVAGIAAGSATGVSGAPGNGVAPHAMILPVQIFTRFDNNAAWCGSGAPCALSFPSDYIAALDYLYDIRDSVPGYKFAAVNLSIGGPPAVTTFCDSDPTKPAIDNLLNAGIPTVIAAGNHSYLSSIESPGCVSSAVTVGATDDGDTIASFSNRSASMLDLFAPGVTVRSSFPGGTFGLDSGTSMSTPMVTGAFAALREGSPSSDVATLLAALKSTGVPVNVSGTPIARVDLRAALNKLTSVNNPPRTPFSPSPANALGGFSLTTGLSWSGGDPDSGDTVKYDVYQDAFNPPTTKKCSAITSLICAAGTRSAGTTYYWKVVAADNHGAVTTGPVWSFTTTGGSGALPNDDVGNALVIGGNSFTYGESIAAATSAVSDPNFPCATGPLSPHFNTVWYRFTPSASGVLTADTSGSATDTLLAVYSGTPGASSVPLACSDDSSWASTSMIDDVALTGGVTYTIEVANYYENAAGTVYLHTTYATPNANPNTPSGPTPGDGGGSVSLTPTLTWTGGDPDAGDTVTYDVYLGTSSPPITKVCTVTAASCSPAGSLLDGATYYWKVVARDAQAGTASGPVWSFTTHNNPPDMPSDPSPAHNATAVSLTPTLTWTGGDADLGDTVTYDVYLGTTDPPTTKICTVTAATCTPPGHLTALAAYHWKVVATDTHGASTDGPIWSFTTINHAPDMPADGASGSGLNPTLTWTGGDPDAGDTVHYDVYFDTANPPTAALAGCTAISAASCTPPAPLIDGTTYTWQVVATDDHAVSTIGPIWSFTAINHAPDAPSSPDPTSGAGEVSLTPALTWTGGDADQGDIVHYTVYLDQTADPSTPVAGCQDITAASCTPSSALTDGTLYYWKVVASDTHGAGTASTVWQFTAHNHAPDMPASPSPADGALDVSAAQSLTWTGGDPDAGDAAHYDVYLDTTSDPVTLLAECIGLTSPSCAPAHLAGATTYHWKVVATDTHGAVTTGPVWRFTTHNNPPDVPSSPSPTSGQTWVGQTPALGWSGGDADPGDGVTYSVYLSKRKNPATLVCGGLTSPGCTPALTLAFRTKYYWKVVATDSHGAVTTGPVWSFTTLFNAPVLRSPRDGAPVYKSTPTLSWRGYRGAGGYHVEVFDADSALIQQGDPLTISFPAGPFEFGVYSWHVQVKDLFGESLYSPLRSFEVTLNKSPRKNTQVRTTRPTFVWQAARGVTYELEVYTLSDDPSPVKTVVLNPPAWPKGSYTTPRSLALTSQTTYYWRVRVTGGDWTLPWMFTVK